MKKMGSVVSLTLLLGVAVRVPASALHTTDEHQTISAGMQARAQVDSVSVAWWHTYGGPGYEDGLSVAQTDDGGYIIGGWTSSFGTGGDVYLIKTDALGDTMWTRTYGGPDNDRGNSVARTDDGGYVIAGYTLSFGAGESDVYLLKTDGVGDTVWTRTYGGPDHDWGNSVAQTYDGGYVIAGTTLSFGAGESRVYLIKTDGVGDTVWTRTYGGTSHGYSVAQTSDGEYIIAGQYEWYGEYSASLWKADAGGDLLWSACFGASGYWACGYSVIEDQTAEAGYVVAGSRVSDGPSGGDLYLFKVDPSGQLEWSHLYGGPGSQWGNSVAQTADGGYIIAGGVNFYWYSDVYLMKTDEVGDSLWVLGYGGPDSDEANSVEVTADGGCVIAGYTYSFGAGEEDVLLLKMEARSLLSVQVTPDTVAVHPGEDLWFTVDVVNETDSTLTFDAWVDGYLPNANPYGGNPVLGPVALTLGPSQGLYGVRRHVTIPWGAPFGSPYKLCVRTGAHPDSVWAEDCFQFAIVPPPDE
jgi:hypothetical protein